MVLPACVISKISANLILASPIDILIICQKLGFLGKLARIFYMINLEAEAISQSYLPWKTVWPNETKWILAKTMVSK